MTVPNNIEVLPDGSTVPVVAIAGTVELSSSVSINNFPAMQAVSGQVFQPLANGYVISDATTAQSAAITVGANVLVFNATADVIFVAVGGAGTVASFTSTAMLPGTRQMFATGPTVTVLSIISNSVNGQAIFFSMGNGTFY